MPVRLKELPIHRVMNSSPERLSRYLSEKQGLSFGIIVPRNVLLSLRLQVLHHDRSG